MSDDETIIEEPLPENPEVDEPPAPHVPLLDLSVLSDAELEAHQSDIWVEQERRVNRATIPGQIAALRAQYVEGGGDIADLTAALEASRGNAAIELEKQG